MCHPHISFIFWRAPERCSGFFSKFSIKMLPITGNNGEPIESPSVCAYSFSLRLNTVDFRHSKHSSIRSIAGGCVRCGSSASLSNFCWIIIGVFSVQRHNVVTDHQFYVFCGESLYFIAESRRIVYIYGCLTCKRFKDGRWMPGPFIRWRPCEVYNWPQGNPFIVVFLL